MSRMPSNQLDPAIKNVWRICDAALLAAAFAGIGLVSQVLLWLFAPSARPAAGAVVVALFVVVCAVWLAFAVPLRYARWRYELTPHYVEISRGILWHVHVVIPFVRVQNIDTRQGPLLRAFGLAGVTISTASGSHVIPGLHAQEADDVRDRAAEFARLAREDL